MSQTKSAATVILGAQWGDEGKGKIIDYFISRKNINVVARCQGGNNAGHTVVAKGKKYDFHIIPSGIINENCFSVIGNGVVINMNAFFDELEHNEITKMVGWEKRIMISECAHLVCGIHLKVDGFTEEKLDTKKLGTTKRGIGPTYSSKCFRNGLRVGDLIADFDNFSQKLRQLVEHYQKQYPSITMNVDDELAEFKMHAERLKKLGLVGDTVSKLDDLRSTGSEILIEGANGTMLDIDFGTYPFVTSSNATVGGAVTGLGLPPTSIKTVIGVAKAYATRVGSGPFPTELLNTVGDNLQKIGKELSSCTILSPRISCFQLMPSVGVTTGRKRRCGWLDLVLLKRAAIINGFTEIALTKLDILDSFDEVKVGTAYTLNGKTLTTPPCQIEDWFKLKVDYQTFAGWKCPITEVRSYNELPEKCRKYVEFIENFIGVPIKWIGVGADREALIVR